MSYLCPLEPLWEESIISFLYRYAEFYSCPFNWVLDKVDKKITRSIYKYRLIQETDYIHKISMLTGLSKKRIKNMCINKYGYGVNLFNKDVPNFYVNIDHTKVCIACLKENMYHRIFWQLNLINICEKHNVYLIHICEKCKSKFTVEDIMRGSCKCGYMFVDMNIEKCSDLNLIKTQKDFYISYKIIRGKRSRWLSHGLNGTDIIALTIYLMLLKMRGIESLNFTLPEKEEKYIDILNHLSILKEQKLTSNYFHEIIKILYEQSKQKINAQKKEFDKDRRYQVYCPFSGVVYTLDILYGMKPINKKLCDCIMEIFINWYDAIFYEIRLIAQLRGHVLRVFWIKELLGIDKNLCGELFENWKRRGTNEYIDKNGIVDTFQKLLYISVLSKQPKNAISILSIVEQHNNITFKDILNAIDINNIRVFFYPINYNIAYR